LPGGAESPHHSDLSATATSPGWQAATSSLTALPAPNPHSRFYGDRDPIVREGCHAGATNDGSRTSMVGRCFRERRPIRSMDATTQPYWFVAMDRKGF